MPSKNQFSISYTFLTFNFTALYSSPLTFLVPNKSPASQPIPKESRNTLAKSGRKKLKISQVFNRQKLAPKIKLSEKLFELDSLVKMVDGKKFVKPIKKIKKTKKKIVIDFKLYPKMRCENCGKEFRLHHEPKKDRKIGRASCRERV